MLNSLRNRAFPVGVNINIASR